MVFLILGGIFTYFAVQYYAEIGRLSTNLTLVGAGTILIGIVLLLTAILLYSQSARFVYIFEYLHRYLNFLRFLKKLAFPDFDYHF